jgi:hypothetical protein
MVLTFSSGELAAMLHVRGAIIYGASLQSNFTSLSWPKDYRVSDLATVMLTGWLSINFWLPFLTLEPRYQYPYKLLIFPSLG